ncbi:aminoglycoside phosphotransferase family protein [Thermoactinospora rubra]|uniref:aminoglycoside phosphotransferase family protein n=1 Tax=Thermoactinospora rubra TaxID=1088767 RepID=UPI000A1138B4|nr:aminoglycoside phosphotransferase family protein [Thermoactinospora rubra]
MGHLRHGYTNSTTGDEFLVVKYFEGPDAAVRLQTERTMLRRYRGRLPVPQLVRVSDSSITTRFVPGEHGQDLLDDGHAREVLTACGLLLRRVQSMPRRSGGVLVHGDFGPNNLLLDPETFEPTALLDWEWAHQGDPVEDLAWCEWIVRMHHPEHVPALPYLFEAYGEPAPPWPVRHAAMLARCKELLEFAGRWEPGGEGEELWRARLETVSGWREVA